MDDLSARLKTVTRLTFFFLSACFLAWFFFPAQQAWWGGLVIGTIASLVNAWHLGWKVIQMGANAASRGTKRVTLGFFTRSCIGLLAIVASTRAFTFEPAATVMGLFVAQLATLVIGFISRDKENARSLRERGEN